MYSLWLMSSCLCILCHYGIAKPNSSNVECVDIYKQPAFQDPSMKNHRISSFALQSMLKSDERNIANIVSETIKCPKGQVPIHRPLNNITDNFIHPDHLSKPGRVLAQQKGGAKFRLHHASLTAKPDPGKKFTGGQATFGRCKPNKVTKGQFSKAAIWIITAKGNNIYNSIQYGWAVHPGLYGDDIPRLTVQWTKTRGDGCYNTNCGGFVQSHDMIHLGMPFADIDKVGVPKKFPTLSIDLIHGLGQWSLTVGSGTIIGYFPKMFFPELDGGATQVSYGGFVSARSGLPSPRMGFGVFPTNDDRTSCFMKELQFSTYINYEDIDPKKVVYASDRPNCYRIFYLNYLAPFDYIEPSDRHAITFGGPGGQCN